MRISLYLAASLSALVAQKYTVEAVKIGREESLAEPQLSVPFFDLRLA